MKGLLLLGVVLLLYRSIRRRRGVSPVDGRFDLMIASLVLVAVGVVMLTIVFKVGLAGIWVVMTGLGLLLVGLALGLMKLRR
jgi:hypothetical protein